MSPNYMNMIYTDKCINSKLNFYFTLIFKYLTTKNTIKATTIKSIKLDKTLPYKIHL